MRGVGQTRNLIDNLPSGRSMVVIPNASLSRLLKEMSEDIRSKDFTKNVKFVVIAEADDCNKLIGYSNPIFFDHSFFTSVSEETARKALDIAHTCSIVRISSGK